MDIKTDIHTVQQYVYATDEIPKLAPLPKACTKQPYPTQPSVPCSPPYPYGCKGACTKEPNKKENNMGYEIETAQRQHLQSRLRDVREAHSSAMRDKYNMNPVRSPKTLEELTAALAKGHYTLNKDMFTADGRFTGWTSSRDAIIWTNPDKPEDKAGYDAAKALLGKAYTAAKDVIIVKSLDDGLKALNDFETATF